MEHQPRNDEVIPTKRCLNLNYSRDFTQEHHIPYHIQSEDLRDVKTEILKDTEMHVEADQQSKEVVEMVVRIKEEESSMQTGTRNLHMRNILEGHLDVTQDSPGERPVNPDINPEGSSHCKSETCSKLCEYSTWELGFAEDQKVDTNIGSYGCSECGKGFSCDEDRDKHQRIHATRKPFSCSDCEKRFQVKSKLIRHVRVHTGEKPYSCTVCGRCFSNKKNLAIHVRRLHPDDKLFSCSDCGMCFHEKGRLVMHRRIHTSEKERPRPYACPECQKGFTKNSDLVRHRRTHTGEKPFSCSECGKCFAQKAQLITHLRVHRVEKPAT